MTKADFLEIGGKAAAAGLSVSEFLLRKGKDEPVADGKRIR